MISYFKILNNIIKNKNVLNPHLKVNRVDDIDY